MSNPPNEIDLALAAAGLPPLDQLAEKYSMRCHDQFAPLCLAGIAFPVVAAVMLTAYRNMAASTLLTLQIGYPGYDASGEGLEAFIRDLREMVKQGPKSVEALERMEAEMMER